jgi:hypothetical protein
MAITAPISTKLSHAKIYINILFTKFYPNRMTYVKNTGKILLMSLCKVDFPLLIFKKVSDFKQHWVEVVYAKCHPNWSQQKFIYAQS